jgi:hypothetical protein
MDMYPSGSARPCRSASRVMVVDDDQKISRETRDCQSIAGFLLKPNVPTASGQMKERT